MDAMNNRDGIKPDGSPEPEAAQKAGMRPAAPKTIRGVRAALVISGPSHLKALLLYGFLYLR